MPLRVRLSASTRALGKVHLEKPGPHAIPVHGANYNVSEPRARYLPTSQPRVACRWISSTSRFGEPARSFILICHIHIIESCGTRGPKSFSNNGSAGVKRTLLTSHLACESLLLGRRECANLEDIRALVRRNFLVGNLAICSVQRRISSCPSIMAGKMDGVARTFLHPGTAI